MNNLLSTLQKYLLDEMKEGIIITDTSGEILYVNSSAEKIRNIKRKDLIGNNAIDCHRETSKENVLRAVAFLRENPEKSYHRMVEDQINQKFYENTYSAIYDENKEVKGVAVITRDITDVRLSEQMRAKQIRAQEISLERLSAQYHSVVLSSMEMLINILEAKDEYTNGHSKRVADIASKLYEYKFGIDEHSIDILWSAKLHDIGKICIPDAILRKTSKLDDSEYEIIKRHSSLASEILKPLDDGKRLILNIRHHHERYDGSGYPDGLSKSEIPLGARIICIADAFDAMRSTRSYRKIISFEDSIHEIELNSGTQFDPEWVEIFKEFASTGSIG